MIITTIKRDDRTYILLKTYADNTDVCDGADVFAIEVTPTMFDDWLAKMALAKELKAKHDISATVYVERSGGEFYGENPDAEELVDADVELPPDWDDQARMESIDLVVTDETLIWEGVTKADTGVRTATVWDHELDELRLALYGTTKCARCGRPFVGTKHVGPDQGVNEFNDTDHAPRAAGG